MARADPAEVERRRRAEEERRLVEERRAKEERRLAKERRAEEERLAEERRAAEQRRLEEQRRAEQAAAASAEVPAVAQVPKVPFENLRVEQRSIAEGSFKSVYRATWNQTGDFLLPTYRATCELVYAARCAEHSGFTVVQTT